MIPVNDRKAFLQFAGKVGYDVGEAMARNVDMQFHNTFDFLPELAVFSASYTVKKTFTRHTTPPKHIKNSIRFFFHNVFDLPGSASRGGQAAPIAKPPYVRVSPPHFRM